MSVPISDSSKRVTQHSSLENLLPRHFRVANALAIEVLVGVHNNCHLLQCTSELERCLVMRYRAAAVTSDIETRPGNQEVKAELRLQRAGRFAIDQQRVFTDAGARSLGRRFLSNQPFNFDAQPMRAGWDFAIGRHDLMTATNIEVVHQHHP